MFCSTACPASETSPSVPAIPAAISHDHHCAADPAMVC